MISLLRTVWRKIFGLKGKFNSWYLNTIVIPKYSEKRAIILDYKERYKSNTMVETGTYIGDTVEMMRSHFKNVYSIELSEEFAARAQKRFAACNNVTILQGDSGVVLKQIYSNLEQPVLFWLDGHYSGVIHVDGQDMATGRGEFDTPIVQELEGLLKDGIRNNVILIDDARLFVGKDGYPKYEDLLRIVGKLGIKPSQVSKKRDIIRIVPQ